MKFIILLILSFSAYGQGTSLLDSEAEVTGFGTIKYRAPIVESNERPIVLFHGIYGGASHRTWRKLVPLLDQAGKRVFIMDLPGVGESDKPKRAYSLEDIDEFVKNFMKEIVRERATVVSESILSNAVLRLAADEPNLVRRVITLNPSGIYSLNEGPSSREQALYDRLFNDDEAAIAFYKNLLQPNSLRFFLAFGFFNDALIDEDLIADFLAVRENVGQRFLTLSFVGGQLYRTFEKSSEGVFLPVLMIFGKEYEAFQDNRIARASDFQAIRPYFEVLEIPGSGSSVQREKPEDVAKAILEFSQAD